MFCLLRICTGLKADKRGAERLVYADDGRIYYTADHYESFEEITE